MVTIRVGKHVCKVLATNDLPLTSPTLSNTLWGLIGKLEFIKRIDVKLDLSNS